MPLKYADWPFLLSDQRTLEETERWWSECYLPGRTDVILSGQEHWRIIAGGMACGKSTALAALERSERGRSFIVHYPSSAWPGAQQALKKETNHLGQIMAAASLVLRQHLSLKPASINPLSATQREFLRWLIEKSDRARAYWRWIESLPSEYRDALRGVDYEDFYPTSTEPLDVKGQIEELINLIHDLNFDQILVLVDVIPVLSDGQIKNLLDLFGWYELLHHPGFALVAAVPAHVLTGTDLAAKTRGRVNVHYLEWSRDKLQEIANRSVRSATDQQASLQELVTPDMWKQLESVLEKEAGGSGPGVWLGLVKILLQFAAKHDRPISARYFSDVRRTYYSECLPLRLEATALQRGVWRGPGFIPLDEQPFNFLRALCKNKGQSVEFESQALLNVAGSKGNLHTLARRIRLAVEPDTKSGAKWIYVKNRKGEGYWIENCLEI
jgi:hypothetical protein